MEERIDDLEIRIAFLERSVESLDGVVRQMADQLELLRQELRQIRETRQNDLVEVSSDPLDEVPPHY